LLIIPFITHQAVLCSDGAVLWQWNGVSGKERTVSAVWFGQDTVAALTTAGNIYTLPSQTGSPPTLFMRRLSVCFGNTAAQHLPVALCSLATMLLLPSGNESLTSEPGLVASLNSLHSIPLRTPILGTHLARPCHCAQT